MTALEMARKCMEQRGYLVIDLPYALPYLPYVNKAGMVGPYGSVDSPVVAISETTVEDLNEQAALIGTPKFTAEDCGHIYRVVAE
jgi:hypothetical protein